MTGNKIAILIPNFNSGPLLADTVESVLRSGMGGDDCAVIVSDNASTDGSVEALAHRTSDAICVTICRRPQNIGRVANWNAVLMAAEAAGFRYVMFLMAGDRLKGATILSLRDQMERSGAMLGTAPYIVTDADNRPQRVARRIAWQVEGAIGHQRFVAQSMARGFLVHAPLGANLYRIDGDVRLRFDPADESHTDHIATAAFLRVGRVCYLDTPVSYWRSRAGRFHNAMSVDQRLEGDLRAIHLTCQEMGLIPDYARIRASLFLRGAVLRRGGLRAAWCTARALTQSVPLSWSWLMQMALSQLRFGTPWVIQA